MGAPIYSCTLEPFGYPTLSVLAVILILDLIVILIVIFDCKIAAAAITELAIATYCGVAVIYSAF